ncbi:hypothetical protein H696_03719 [Fonticula alba]|uniref:Protein N-terminal glutamine amidohydrolase n=1 Tax=Fonticula alba TaxID=691883 RepID=A0A058Z4T2_FONAL|nr:hypothetical protein H696_03719 [Fonticula alba]KCV69285.1 hypothetical protein H696_03719 [Fonticula alba]|eukprot:XP_009495850.1 hypothetical protein H696_03719 [Fonticula alba]
MISDPSRRKWLAELSTEGLVAPDLPDARLHLPQLTIDPNTGQPYYAIQYCEENIYRLARQIVKQLQDAGRPDLAAQCSVVFMTGSSGYVHLSWSTFSDEYLPRWPMDPSSAGCLWSLIDYHVILVTPAAVLPLLAGVGAGVSAPRAPGPPPGPEVVALATVVPSARLPRMRPATLVDDPSGVLVWDFDFVADFFPCTAASFASQSLEEATFSIRLKNQRQFRVLPAEDYLAYFASDRSHMLNEDSEHEYVAPPPPAPAIRGEKAISDMTLDAFRCGEETPPGDLPTYGTLMDEATFRAEILKLSN